MLQDDAQNSDPLPRFRRSQGLRLFLLCLGGCITIYGFSIYRGMGVPLSELPGVLCTDCPPEPRIHPPIAGATLLNRDRPLTQFLKTSVDRSQISLLVEKSKYRLTVFYRQKAVKSYPVVFGGNPTGDKLQEGDKKTPEGIFRIREQYPHAEWSKFLWLDYPTQYSWQKHHRAKVTGQINPFSSIGGEVGIHGVPQGYDTSIDARSNWTLGCVSLKNKDIDELYEFTQIGTIVEILP
jgi:L,D-transpeptidase catalytic domain